MNYDVFISHSSKDMGKYIIPLCQALESYGIKYWLDAIEIEWGDNLINKINDGIIQSQYMLICFSENFLLSNWTNPEFTSAYSIQNNDGRKRILPLILNSKEKILEKIPLLNSIVYKDMSLGFDGLSDYLNNLINPINQTNKEDLMSIFVQSKYSGKKFRFSVPKTASYKMLRDRAINTLGLNESVEVGASDSFKIKWVFIDSDIDHEWNNLKKHEQNAIVAFIRSNKGVKKIYDEYEQVNSDWKFESKLFFLYAVEDIKDESKRVSFYIKENPDSSEEKKPGRRFLFD